MKHISKDELINYNNRHPDRKLQDLFHLNSEAESLDDIYVASDDGNLFYINTPCIVASSKTIIKDETYLLLDLETDEIEEYRVKLLDATVNCYLSTFYSTL